MKYTVRYITTIKHIDRLKYQKYLGDGWAYIVFGKDIGFPNRFIIASNQNVKYNLSKSRFILKYRKYSNNINKIIAEI